MISILVVLILVITNLPMLEVVNPVLLELVLITEKRKWKKKSSKLKTTIPAFLESYKQKLIHIQADRIQVMD